MRNGEGRVPLQGPNALTLPTHASLNSLSM